jgi:hypothetical protein
MCFGIAKTSKKLFFLLSLILVGCKTTQVVSLSIDKAAAQPVLSARVEWKTDF